MQNDQIPTDRRVRGLNFVRDMGWPRSPTRRKPGEAFWMFALKAPVRAVRWSVRFFTAPMEARRLERVYTAQTAQSIEGVGATRAGTPQGLERCDIRYINLDHRSDRREEFEREMLDLNVSWHLRESAVAADPGILGCGLSHSKVLRSWDARPGRLLLVCEDDAEFVVTRPELDALIEEFVSTPALKVLTLAHRTAWNIPISERLAISSDIQTTAAYVVKPESVPGLVQAFSKSVRRLRAGAPSRTAALDKVWKEMQRQQLFALPRVPSAIQRAGYSDIERKIVDYYSGL